MPFIPSPRMAQVELRFLLMGEKVENTLWFVHGGGDINQPNLDELVGRLQEWAHGGHLDLMTNAAELIEVFAKDMTNPSGLVATAVAPAGSIGRLGNQPSPANVTLNISFRTHLSGRSYRGGNKVIGIDKGQTVGNRVLATYRTAWVVHYQDLLPAGQVVPVPWTWIVRSEQENKVKRGVAVGTPILNVVAVNDNIDSARRRLEGRGQ